MESDTCGMDSFPQGMKLRTIQFTNSRLKMTFQIMLPMMTDRDASLPGVHD